MICQVCALAGDSFKAMIARRIDKKPTKRDLMVARELHRSCMSPSCSCQHKVEQYVNPVAPGKRA